MRLDSNPRAMALIMVALGVLGIGVVLTLGFFSNNTLLGVGITMGVIGGAGSILGCIHMASLEQKKRKAKKEHIAPERIPSDAVANGPNAKARRADDDDDDDGELYYAPCSVSPPRDGRGASIIPGGANGGGAGMVLSPFQERSFPVPVLPQHNASRGVSPDGVVLSPYRVVIDHGDYRRYERGGEDGPLVPTQLLVAPAPASAIRTAAANGAGRAVSFAPEDRGARCDPTPMAGGYGNTTDALGSAIRAPSYAPSLALGGGGGPGLRPLPGGFSASGAASPGGAAAFARGSPGGALHDEDALPAHFWSPR